jgi:A/G-specific adenine glycosylase
MKSGFQMAMPENGYEPIQVKLLNWFESNQRKLPWRLLYRPYEVWISEIMLQQTQVKTMLPYYSRWMERFPDLKSVAHAPEEDLLKHWEGMGYYSRARNIHKAAQVLVKDYGAEFPRDYDLMVGLPGIGRYTAGAILSIAFNLDFPAVDGNVARIFSRLFDVAAPLGDRESQRVLWSIAGGVLPKGKARSFNQALMDLGALVCTPRNPSCSRCPVSAHCQALQMGVVSLRPIVQRSRDILPIHTAVGILGRQGKVFIQKRAPSGLMPHLWEFPGGKIQGEETPEEALVREFREELELNIRVLQKIAVIRHQYTTFRVTLHAFACQTVDACWKPVLRSAVDGRWVGLEELDRYTFPAANRKLIRRIQEKPFDLPGWN